ncbi:hypothetical protein BE221DRAFT_69092 [Ostreococcus tauri]|uniref:RNA-binding S4 domain-containing protein n=1 Tax=Ostreococcus tauri TaxID=70448 RepID=A0A1Y5IIM1_OSTTA|nr:hypothetical protein BE221DRAFT_69092 [Ostreococcus tauri]
MRAATNMRAPKLARVLLDTNIHRRTTRGLSKTTSITPESSSNKEDAVLSHCDPLHKETVSRAIERGERALERWSVETTEFMDPGAMASVVAGVRARFGDEVAIEQWGGFSAAERRRATMSRSETPASDEEVRANVKVLRVSGNFMFDAATHRDFLGAILGTGIKRERVGDIVVTGERGADVMVTPEMCEFLSTALTSVRTVKVEAREVDASELKVPEPKTEEMQTSESSTRLDAIGSAGFRMSRSKFMAHVDSGDVKVNWKEVSKGRHDLNAGDVISCRGKGRVEVLEINPARKEGRFFVRLLRFV